MILREAKYDTKTYQNRSGHNSDVVKATGDAKTAGRPCDCDCDLDAGG